MIQLLDWIMIPESYPEPCQIHYCFLCGFSGLTRTQAVFRPRVSAQGELRITGGNYDPLFAHDTCLSNQVQELDFVLRQRAIVPHSFSLRN